MKNTFSKIVMICAVGFMFSTVQAAEWATDLSTLDNVHQDTSAACSPSTNVLCADNGDCIAPAALALTVPADAIATTSGDALAKAVAPNGGWVYNAYGSGSCETNWVCISDPADVLNHVKTKCTGIGLSEPATIEATSATNCITGYTNCIGGDDGVCETDYGTTDYITGDNNNYTITCAAACDTNYYDCNDLGIGTGDGCEIHRGDTATLPNTAYYTCTNFTCTSGTFERTTGAAEIEGCLGVTGESCTVNTGADIGLPGTCTGLGTTGDAATGVCACSAADIPEFAGGGSVDAAGAYTPGALSFSSATALLQGDNTHATGAYVQFGTDANADGDLADEGEVEFEINGSGQITAGFIGGAELTANDTATEDYVLSVNKDGEAVWVAPSSMTVTGDDLGNHTATQDILLGANRLVGEGAHGVSLNADGELVIEGGITLGGAGHLNLSSSKILGSGGTGIAIDADGLVTLDRKLTVGGDIDLSGSKIVSNGGTDGLSIDDAGVVTLDSNLYVGGNIDVASGAKIVGAGGSDGISIDGDGNVLVDGTLTFAGMLLPGADGTNGQVMKTDGAGIITWENLDVTGDISTALGDYSTTVSMAGWDQNAADDITTSNSSAWDKNASDDVTTGDIDDEAAGTNLWTAEKITEVITSASLISGSELAFEGWDKDASDDLALTNLSATGNGLTYDSSTGEFRFDDQVISMNTGNIEANDGDILTNSQNIATNAGEIQTVSDSLSNYVLSGDTDDWDLNAADDVTVGSDGQCAVGQLLQYSDDLLGDGATTTDDIGWECVATTSLDASAQTLDDAYNAGTDVASRTVTVDGQAVKFHATSGLAANVFEIFNEGNAAALSITDATGDLLVVDNDGNTVVKQLRLVASVASETTGLPSVLTCTSANVGDMTYSVAPEGVDAFSGTGAYFGCKLISTETVDGGTDDVYKWVSMEVFGG